MRLTANVYALTVLVVLLAGLIRLAFAGFLADTFPLSGYFLPVLFAAWLGGLRPALLAMGLGLALALWQFFPARLMWLDHSGLHLSGILLFVSSSLAVAVLGERTHASQTHMKDLAVRALQQAETLCITLASIGNGVVTTDSRGKISYLNPAAEELTGWTSGSAQGRDIETVLPIQDEQTQLPLDLEISQVLKTGNGPTASRSAVLFTSRNLRRFVELRLTALQSPDGHIAGAVIILHDVTDRREAETHRQASQRQMMTTLESISDGFARFDRDWRYTYINAAAEQILGRSRSELVGQVFWEVYPETVGTQLEREYRRAMQDQEVVYMENHFEPTGRWYEIRIYPTATDRGVVIFFRDITDSKRSANALLESELRFQKLADAMPQIVYVCDAVGNVTYVNQQWIDYTGRRWGHPEDLRVAVHPDDLQPLVDNWYQAAASGRLHQFEFRLKRASDQTYRWFLTRASAIRDENQQIVQWYGTSTDIHDRKLLEAEREAREERLRLAIEFANLGCWDWQVSDNRLVWTPRTYELFGVNTQTPLNFETFEACIHPDDLASNRAANELAWRTNQYRNEFRILLPDGTHRWVSASGRFVSDEQEHYTRMLGVVMDITDRKRSEETLRRQSEQLRRLALVAIRLTTLHGSETILNLIAEEARMLVGAQSAAVTVSAAEGDEPSARLSVVVPDPQQGQAAAASVAFRESLAALVCRTGQPLRLCRNTNPTSLQQLRQQLEPLSWTSSTNHSRSTNHAPSSDSMADELLPETVLPLRAESPSQWSQGSWSPGPPESALLCSWLAVPLVGTDGENMGWLELTDRLDGEFTVDDEAVLIQLAQLASVALENSRLVESLKDSDRRKNEFLATLAHELRNPLAPIRNAMAILQDPSIDPERLQWSSRIIRRQIAQMTRLIDDLMDISRISRGRIELQRAAVPLQQIVDAAVETSQPLIESRQHQLLIDLPAEPIVLFADLTRMSQVLLNLLNNAAKYTDNGGTIRLKAVRSGDEVLISVTDSGVGIPPDQLDSLFELFSQFDSSLDRSQGGLGIGLALARRLVELHGGTIEASSSGTGQGATFTVRLPSCQDDELPDTLDDQPISTLTSHCRVLIVDDYEEISASLAILLQISGYEVFQAADGAEGIRIALEQKPDVILLDLGLPKINGLDAAREIRRRWEGRQPILIAITGWGQVEDLRRSEAAGFDQHLVKPVDPQQLLQILSRAAAERADRDSSDLAAN